MVTAPQQILSLADFFDFDDGTDSRYELEDGKLLIMPPESDRNLRIASFLFAYFVQAGIPFYRLRIGTEIVVVGSRTTVRLPDLVVLSGELAIALQDTQRSTITLDMLPPELVVEVVSPGKKNIDRDYRYKRSQYGARGIGEYWIIDPIAQKITILTLIEGLYEETVFVGEEVINSVYLQSLDKLTALTAFQLLQARTVSL